MEIKEQQKGEIETQNMPQDVADQTMSVNESRRRFTKSGLAVSGVLLTLASRSALGAGAVCKTPSGFISGNASTHGTPQICSGLTPGYWKTQSHLPDWVSTGLTPGTCSGNCNSFADWSSVGASMFCSFFSCSGNAAKYSGLSLMQVMWMNGNGHGSDPSMLGAHTVAALLNARKGLTPESILSEAQVKNIFNEWSQKGYFEPTAGVKWYGADIVEYLKTTMPL